MEAELTGKSQYNRLQFQSDLDNMLDTPTTRGVHRRTQSETFFGFTPFDDDIILDDVVPDFNLHFSPPPPTAVSSSSASDTHMQQEIPIGLTQPKSHFRSLSVDADFFSGFDIDEATWSGVAQAVGPQSSMDGLATASSFDSSKKAMPPQKLAQLALTDPKKAKRILANRQSAARSKERKVHYTSELEKKVQTLQAEATTLSTQVTKLQRDTSGLTTDNKELRLRLEALEQQAHLRDALNEALNEELKHLKILAGEIQVVNGNGSLQYTQPQALNSFRGSQPQYAQQQQPLYELPRSTDVNTNLSRHPQPNFRCFNQRV